MSLFDLAPAIALLGKYSVSISRPNAVTWGAGGIANTQTFSSFSVTDCSVQPIAGKDMKHMREGDQPSDYISVWGPFQFNTNDRLTISGKGVFKVHMLLQWNEEGNFSKVLARKLDANEPRA